MIYPNNFPEHNQNHAERKVFEALKNLDSYQFDVFWNRTFAGKTKKEEDLYEIDFLIFDLRDERLNHIYVLEVKGGNLKFSAEDNAWFQSGREMETAPDQQVMNYTSSIISRYHEQILHKVPVTWLLWFPDGTINSDSLSTQFHDWRVLDQHDLDDPGAALDAAKEAQEGSYTSFSGVSPEEYEGVIKKDLTKSLGISTNLRNLLEDMKISIELAEAHQKIYFTGLFSIPRLAVEGCAGSGKTILAKCGAEMLNEKGDKVLFLCYNRFLNSRLAEELSPEIMTATVMDFMKDLIEDQEPGWLEGQEGSEGEKYREVPSKFRELLKKHQVEDSEKYDAILIDEAQDMDVSWLNAFLKFLKPQGKYLVFFDRRQNIFRTNFALPISESWTRIPLTYNYRNTKRINTYINETLDTVFVSGPVPEGEQVKLRKYDAEDIGGALYRSLMELHQVGKIPLDKIKIITDGAAHRWKLEELNGSGRFKYELLNPEKEQEANKVYYASIHMFKGCESEVVILLLEKPIDETKYPNRLYTQLSRAKSLLYVLEPYIEK